MTWVEKSPKTKMSNRQLKVSLAALGSCKKGVHLSNSARANASEANLCVIQKKSRFDLGSGDLLLVLT